MSRLSGRPPFPGGKRRLLPPLWAALARVLPVSAWPQLTFLDAFLGSGAVTADAKARFQLVFANDAAPRSSMIGRALLENVSVRLTPPEVLRLATPLPMAPLDLPPCPLALMEPLAECAARFRQHWHRGEFVGVRRDLLGVVILNWLWRAFPMSLPSATDARHVAAGHFDRVSAKRLPHYLRQARRLSQPQSWLELAEACNAQVRPGRVVVTEADVFAFLADAEGDVLYLDPPYPGTQDYGRAFAATDAFFGWPPQPPSAFASRRPPLDALLDAGRHVPVLLLSLNNAVFDADALTRLVGRHRASVTVIPIPYRHYAALASATTRQHHQEFLVVAE